MIGSKLVVILQESWGLFPGFFFVYLKDLTCKERRTIKRCHGNHECWSPVDSKQSRCKGRSQPSAWTNASWFS